MTGGHGEGRDLTEPRDTVDGAVAEDHYKVEIRRVIPSFEILVRWQEDGAAHFRITDIEPLLDGDVAEVLHPEWSKTPQPR